MQTLNRVHAEPAMQSAARQLGAELLPVFPEEVFDCDLQPGWGSRNSDCTLWSPRYSGLLRLRDARGTLHQALPIDIHDWYYARLARHGDKLVLLVPKLTRRQVDHLKQCECDGMPRFSPPLPPFVVFSVEGTPDATNVQKVEVPVTEDYVRFDCGTYLM